MDQFSQLAGKEASARSSGAETSNAFDVQIQGVRLYYLPIETRVPLKFGSEVLTSVTCARAHVTVKTTDGRLASGWGETPLSVQWVWPSTVSYSIRHERIKQFAELVATDIAAFDQQGHALELGYRYQQERLPKLLEEFNAGQPADHCLPYLAALLCLSPFDIALHDAYGVAHDVSVYETYAPPYMNWDLADFFDLDGNVEVDFSGKYPDEFLQFPATADTSPKRLMAWHLVGGLDAISRDDLCGAEPEDEHPVELAGWIERDQLKCLKVKLRGNDAAWDYERLVRVGKLAQEHGVEHLTADYNCMVTDPEYVIEMLDRLQESEPAIYDMILYVEQPFPYDLAAHSIDVSKLAQRKPLLMDESAHDWQHVRLGRSLGWNGVALKTCKTQTGAILSLCWAKAHGMSLMVQDLTNPMLAQIPHVLLAAHAGTMMGVETNAMQFYPEASSVEASVHNGLYRRRDGQIDFSSIRGPGFGYRTDEIGRTLPAPTVSSPLFATPADAK
jgi:L-alanine-DL-glutamate epimerase-like enolase superfamily enzyme